MEASAVLQAGVPGQAGSVAASLASNLLMVMVMMVMNGFNAAHVSNLPPAAAGSPASPARVPQEQRSVPAGKALPVPPAAPVPLHTLCTWCPGVCSAVGVTSAGTGEGQQENSPGTLLAWPCLPGTNRFTALTFYTVDRGVFHIYLFEGFLLL